MPEIGARRYFVPTWRTHICRWVVRHLDDVLPSFQDPEGSRSPFVTLLSRLKSGSGWANPPPKERADRTFSYGHDPQIMLDPSWFPPSFSDSGNNYYYLV